MNTEIYKSTTAEACYSKALLQVFNKLFLFASTLKEILSQYD